MSQAMIHEPPGRHQSRIAAASGWIGSALEYYDFFIYATAASLVFPQIFFPSNNPTVAIVASLATYGVGYVARPDRRLRARPLGRHARPQERAARLPVPDGLLHDGGRTCCRPISRSAVWRADPARHAAADPGLCGRRRNLRREFDDPRARAFGRRGYFASFTLQGVQAGQILAAAVFLPLELCAAERPPSCPGAGACRSCSAWSC